MANMSDYVLARLDQTDPDDRLIDSDVVETAARMSRITDRSVLAKYERDLSDFDLLDDSVYVTFTMTDLFYGDPSGTADGYTYYFSPPFYIHSASRRLTVNDVVITTGFTFNEQECTVTFDSQQAAGSVVEITGIVVDFRAMMNRILTELESRIMVTPDVHGARHHEWQRRVGLYRAREFGAGIG